MNPLIKSLRCILTASLILLFGFNGAAKDHRQLKDRIILVDAEAYKLAIADIQENSNKRFNSKKYLDALKRFEQNKASFIQGIEANNKSEIQKAKQLLDLLDEGLLANPVLDFDKIILLRREIGDKARQYVSMKQALGIERSNFTNIDKISPSGKWKNEISILSDLRGDQKLKTLYRPVADKIINHLNLNYDGKNLMYASIGTHNRWHLFNLNTETGVSEQITPDDITDFDCFDGCYLPNGDIIFCSTGTFLGLPCTHGSARMAALYRINPQTKEMRQLTFDQDSNWEPVVMNDGKVLYQRWEYANLPHSNSRIIFTMNPDGTSQLAHYGSNSYFPTSCWANRPIPGTPSSFIGVVSGHHSVSRAGRLMIFNPEQGRHEADGVVTEIPHRGKKVEPIIRDRLPDGNWPLFMNPYPLNDKYFLVSAKMSEDALWGLYLVDVYNNMTLLYEAEGEAVIEAHPFKASPKPPVIPDRVNLNSKKATVFLQDIYHGPGLKGIEKGAVKNLRIGSYFFSPFKHGGLLGTLGMDGPWDIMRILGTVPVEEDGSAMFEIPANTPVFIQPLDEDGKALQLMRSWFTGMPGETVSCTGCHENRNEVALPKMSIASRKKPSTIQPWYGDARNFGFPQEVQPILDKHCVSCHNEQSPGIPYLKGDKRITDWSSKIGGKAGSHYGGKFSESYANLHRYVRRPGIESDMHLLTPMDFHADQTELIQLLKKGHHNVKLDQESLEKLYCWIDLNAPYHGYRQAIPEYELAEQYVQRLKETRLKYANTVVDFDAEAPAIETPEPVMPAPYEKLSADDVNPQGWPMNKQKAIEKQLGVAWRDNRLYKKTITLAEGIKLELVKIPSGEFLMGSKNNRDEQPRTAVSINKPYWMARFEVSNEMYALYDAEHDSRDEHRHGYQFGIAGYTMNKPLQPVVRVSWQEAMDFCRWLSEKTGYKFTLPTEAQWEWACRAGSDKAYSFGDLGADFTSYANMGDQKLAEFAACTSYKYYEGAEIIDNPNRYDDWIPRDTIYNDGGFISDEIGRYRANYWDLNDMHGNVWEWTRSDYKPYPYQDGDGRNALNPKTEKVVRGGSWYARPHRCTSSYRVSYIPYQKVFDVGFRVVMEE